MKKEKETLEYRYIDCPGFYGEKEEIRGSITEHFVHCNFGWSGNSSGWYRADVFDTNLYNIHSYIKKPRYNCDFQIINNIY